MSDPKRLLRLIRSLAYDAPLFERCAALIKKIVTAGNIEERNDEGYRIFISLFPIYCSGTYATAEQRLAVLHSMVLSGDAKEETLAIGGLKAMLEAVHFGPGWEFEFGTTRRDYGYYPRTTKDIENWYGKTLNLAENLACSDTSAAHKVRETLAQQFRGLWTVSVLHDQLVGVCSRISEKDFWPQGWVAIRQTIHFDSSGLSDAAAKQLALLEAVLRPKDLVQKVRSIVLREELLAFGIDSTVDSTTDVMKSYEQVESTAHELGLAISVDIESLSKLLPELVAAKSEQIWFFGRGLAEGTVEPRAIWQRLISQLHSTPEDERTPYIFRGFLNSLNGRDPALVESLLEESLESETLGQWYPVMQTAVGINKTGVNRLIRSLDVGKAWIGIYRNLVGGGVTNSVPGNDFNDLLLRIAAEPGGLDVAIEILCMRITHGKGQSSPSQLIYIGCELMRRLPFTQRSRHDDYRLGIVTKACLIGDEGVATVREICLNLKDAVASKQTYAFYHADLIQVLIDKHPFAVLDALCGQTQADLQFGASILEEAAQLRRNPFDSIPEDDLIRWCDQYPELRYPVVAAGVTSFQWSTEASRQQWTRIAHRILQIAPNRIEVLKKFIDKFSPLGGTASPAGIIESNARLLDDLGEYSDPALNEFIVKQKQRLVTVARADAELDRMLYQEREDRFEY